MNAKNIVITFRIAELVAHYGVENIFGSSYWEGFTVSEEESEVAA